MSTLGYNIILSRFSQWSGINCWVMCNKDKQPATLHMGEWLIPKDTNEIVPRRYGAGMFLRWKTEPQDHITNLSRVLKITEMFDCFGYGFGIIIGLENNIVCFDFDHVVDSDGSVPIAVRKFLKKLDTFVEVSSSGTGLHAFVVCDSPDIEEYGFNPNICDGKAYVGRFIKLTGDVWGTYNVPIRTISEKRFSRIKKSFGEMKPAVTKVSLPQTNTTLPQNGSYNGSITDWVDTLTRAGIRYETLTKYVGTRRRGAADVKCIWSGRIMCPQAHLHTGYETRASQFNPDCAILSQWSDGTTSLVCNHNHCVSRLNPNLLQKLWVQIKTERVVKAKAVLSKYGRVI
jgi:hypothetical protein